MTMRRGTRRPVRNPVRRSFLSQTATATAPGATQIDLTPQTEIAAEGDSRVGELLITGIGSLDTTGDVGIVRFIVWVGRVSTTPAFTDRGVRTRDIAYTELGTGFAFRIRGLRVDAGALLKCQSQLVVETNSSSTHVMTVTTKWAFRELRQG